MNLFKQEDMQKVRIDLSVLKNKKESKAVLEILKKGVELLE